MADFALAKQQGLLAFTDPDHDNSPKGSIDFPIRELCRTVNMHPDYFTLSTCSGRISLFESSAATATSGTGADVDATNGKGQSGRWLLSRHGTVSADRVAAAVASCSSNSSLLTLKHEPALLHISCRDIVSADRLLKASLAAGFRESGITTSSRKEQAMVAIRGVGLMLSTPVYQDLAVSEAGEEWLKRLVDAANDRFRANEKRLVRLAEEIERALYDEAERAAAAPRGVVATWSTLEPLNLWGNACVTANGKVYSIGGYGEGPATAPTHNARRQFLIYELELAKSQQNAPTQQQWVTSKAVLPVPLEHLSACRSPIDPELVLVFGGRQSPTNPSSALFVFDAVRSTLAEIAAANPPAARWGHTMTALSGRNNMLAVVVGGRDADSALAPSVHVLCSIDDSHSTLFWRELKHPLLPPLFHHSVSFFPSAGDISEKLLVCGGLNSIEDFNSTSPSYVIEISSDADALHVQRADTPSPLLSFANLTLGVDATSDDGGGVMSNRRMVALAGGVKVAAGLENEPVLELFEADLRGKLTQRSVVHKGVQIDVGAMVHGSGVMVPSETDSTQLDLLLLGGGAPSFAFRPAFAPCYRVALQIDSTNYISNANATSKTKFSAPVVGAVAAASADAGARPQPPQPTSPKSSAAICVLVEPCHAKFVKTQLEENNLLDKRFRIGKSKFVEKTMAVPVMPLFFRFYAANRKEEGQEWLELISKAKEGGVREDLQLNKLAVVTSGRGGKGGATLPLLHQIVQEWDAKANLDELPKSLERLGDDVVVVPAKVLVDEAYNKDAFWKKLAEAHRAKRVARRGEIDPESPIRHSGHVLLWPSRSSAEAERTGEGTAAWVTVIEHGIKQSFDMCRVMFSRGNVTEKERFGALVQKDEVVLDLYSGIGYYTLPALVHGKAKHVYSCEWNSDAVFALKYNLKQNSVSNRCTVLQGDSRVEGKKAEGKCDRVSLGLLPSSEGTWEVAVGALKRGKEGGGWLHVHGNVAKGEGLDWSAWVAWRMLELGAVEEGWGWGARVKRVEKVKSFAPNVDHLVCDVWVGASKTTDESSGVEAGVVGVEGRGAVEWQDV
jgi:tRNA G37 N-methylase Trm5/tRNA(Phe) wybutosine-synthesizing methylase Tyw3